MARKQHRCPEGCTARHVAIVGSAELTPEQHTQAGRLVRLIVTSYRWQVDAQIVPEDYIVIVSGASPKGGVDLLAAECAYELRLPLLEFKPKNNRWEPDGYKARNLEIAFRADILYRVATQESSTYGSGWTADRAQELGKPVFRFYI